MPLCIAQMIAEVICRWPVPFRYLGGIRPGSYVLSLITVYSVDALNLWPFMAQDKNVIAHVLRFNRYVRPGPVSQGTACEQTKSSDTRESFPVPRGIRIIFV